MQILLTYVIPAIIGYTLGVALIKLYFVIVDRRERREVIRAPVPDPRDSLAKFKRENGARP